MRLELLQEIVTRELDVGVLESDDEPERDVVVAHRVDPRAAELAVAGALAERPAHRVHDPVERLRDLPDLLHAERPDLRVAPLKAEPVDRGARQMARRALREDGHLRRHVDAGLEVRERCAVLAAALVARTHADHAAVLEQQRLPGRLGEDHRAACLGLLREKSAELGDGHHPVAAVHHRGWRRDANRGALRQQVDGLAVDLSVGRHLLDGHPAGEELPYRARIHDSAGEQMRPGLFPLLEHRHGDVAEAVANVRALLEQLPQPDRAREAAGATSDDQDPHVDPLVRRVGRRGDRLGVSERGRVVGRADAARAPGHG